jgi:hypothetical protein
MIFYFEWNINAKELEQECLGQVEAASILNPQQYCNGIFGNCVARPYNLHQKKCYAQFFVTPELFAFQVP